MYNEDLNYIKSYTQMDIIIKIYFIEYCNIVIEFI